MHCPVESVCVGEIEGNNIACQLNVGASLGLVEAHCTSLPYLYAVEYAHAYMKEILLRGQPFIRFKQASAGQHSVRRLYLRVARDPADFSVIHMYKSLCARILGADAKIRFPVSARAEGMYRDYNTPFYDDTAIAPQHPMNRDSIYELDTQTVCSVSRVNIARYIVINGFKYEYARSMPAEKIIEITYGMLNCGPGDILGKDARVLMTRAMVGKANPICTLPEPPPGAQPPYFHLGPEGGGTVPDHPNAVYEKGCDTCLACSFYSSPADVWASSGRHSRQDRCNCPPHTDHGPPQLTRLAEDLSLFSVDDIRPARCFTVMLTPRHGNLILQPPTSLQGLFWIKCLKTLKRYQTVTPTIRPYMRLDEYFYASIDGIAAARKIDDLFSLLPSPAKTQLPQERDVWAHLVMSAVSIPQTGAQHEAMHGANPVLVCCRQAMAEEEAKSGPAPPLELLKRAYQRGALKLSLHPFSYAHHAQFLLFRRMLIAGTHAAVVNLSASVDEATGKPRVTVSAPNVYLLCISPDLKSFIFSHHDNLGMRLGTIRQGAPINSCCGLLEGSQSPLFCQARYPMTVRFVGTRAVLDSLGPLLSPAEIGDLVHTSSTHIRSNIPRSHVPHVRRLAAEANIPLTNCEFGPPHEKHYDIHVVLPEFANWALWCQCVRWLLWVRRPNSDSAAPSPEKRVCAPSPVSIPSISSIPPTTRDGTVSASVGSAKPVPLPSLPASSPASNTAAELHEEIMGLPVHLTPLCAPSAAAEGRSTALAEPLISIPVKRQNKLVLQLISPETEASWEELACGDVHQGGREPSATGIRRYFLTGYLSTKLTHMTPAIASKIRNTLRNNILTRSYNFNHLFRVSHIVNQDERFGILILAYFRMIGTAIILRRLRLGDPAASASDPASASSPPSTSLDLVFDGVGAGGSGGDDAEPEAEQKWNTTYTIDRYTASKLRKHVSLNEDEDVAVSEAGPAASPVSMTPSASAAALSVASSTPSASRSEANTAPYDIVATRPKSSSSSSSPENTVSSIDASAPASASTAAPRLKAVLDRFSSLTALRSPYIVAHLGYYMDSPQKPSCTEGSCIYLVTELTEMGSLSDLLHHQPHLPVEQVRYIAQCILLGLKHLHGQRLTHGELHSGHVNMDSSGGIKVGGLMISQLRKARYAAVGCVPGVRGSAGKGDTGDCGDGSASVGVDDEKQDITERQRLQFPPMSPLGSIQQSSQDFPSPVSVPSLLRDPPWLPPESTIGYNDTPAADVWAFGVILLQLCSGALTLAEVRDAADGVLQGQQTGGGAGLTALEAEMVYACLQREPELRPSVSELISMRFISGSSGRAEKWPQQGEMEWKQQRFSQWMRGCARWVRDAEDKQ
jgi:serine/threonine protein kinase